MGLIDAYSASVVKLPALHLIFAIIFPCFLGGLAFAIKTDVRPELDQASKGFENRGAFSSRAAHPMC